MRDLYRTILRQSGRKKTAQPEPARDIADSFMQSQGDDIIEGDDFDRSTFIDRLQDRIQDRVTSWSPDDSVRYLQESDYPNAAVDMEIVDSQDFFDLLDTYTMAAVFKDAKDHVESDYNVPFDLSG